MITLEEFREKYNRTPSEKDPDWKREVEMSQLSLMKTPLLMPGDCLRCKSSNDDGRGYIDLGVDLDITPGYNHTLYLCLICVKEIATFCGLITPPVADTVLTKKLMDLASNINDLVESVDELKEVFGGASDDISVISTPDIGDSGQNAISETIPEGESSSTDSVDTDNSPEQRSNEPDSSGGPSNVQNLDDILGRPSF